LRITCYDFVSRSCRWSSVSTELAGRVSRPLAGRGTRRQLSDPNNLRCTASSQGRYCGGRVAKLYLGGRPVFACRHCLGLTFASQQETPRDRAVSQAQNIRKRLGGTVNLIDDPFPEKPRRQHWRTYGRLMQRAEAVEERSNALMLKWLRRRPTTKFRR
jgi:hypothetical protein